ncbi:MAG: CinA family protein [Candidatus Izemoplasmatales bacterium]|jgi:nicotinamide-nucleotide amidase|nr:CinA family protein [Candidatus Izemoplasmatales bacterium]MDD3865684.1 CinA family protein [Candidatus Izemoplasmatales bacterium]
MTIDTNLTRRVVYEEEYTLYNINSEETMLLLKEKIPHYRDVKINVSDENGDLIIQFYTEAEDQRHFNRTLKVFKKTFCDFIITPPNTSLETVLFQLVRDKKYHISTAESCTGGMLSSRIINVSGSSSIIEEAFITYSEDAKMKILGVDESCFEAYGTFSIECAEEMARCLKKITNCELGIAITGIAGPSGGTETNPVGTVYFGFAFLDKLFSYKKWFSGDRTMVRKKAVSFALAEAIVIIKTTK